MIGVEIQYELSKCSQALKAYGTASGKSEADILIKQGGKLAWNISSGLRKLQPTKGSIRAERLAALKSGGGVLVRDSVKANIAAKYNATYSLSLDRTLLAQKKGKKTISYLPQITGKSGKLMNLQALMVERELSLRESARGFSGYAAPRPPRSYAAEAAFNSDRLDSIESRYGFLLSTFGLHLSGANKHIELKWVGAQNDSYHDALGGLSKSKQQVVVIAAVQETTRDIIEYIKSRDETLISTYGLS